MANFSRAEVKTRTLCLNAFILHGFHSSELFLLQTETTTNWCAHMKLLCGTLENFRHLNSMMVNSIDSNCCSKLLCWMPLVNFWCKFCIHCISKPYNRNFKLFLCWHCADSKSYNSTIVCDVLLTLRAIRFISRQKNHKPNFTSSSMSLVDHFYHYYHHHFCYSI